MADDSAPAVLVKDVAARRGKTATSAAETTLRAYRHAARAVHLHDARGLITLEKLIAEGRTAVIVSVGTVIRSPVFSRYNRRTFDDLARRLHLSAPSRSFGLVCAKIRMKRPKAGVSVPDAQRAVNEQWQDMIARTGGWTAGHSNIVFADVCLLHSGQPGTGWRCLQVLQTYDDFEPLTELMDTVRAMFPDCASFMPYRIEDVAQQCERLKVDAPRFDAAQLRHGDTTQFAACAKGGRTMMSMRPCLLEAIMQRTDVHAAGELRALLGPRVHVVLFLPFKCYIMPDSGGPIVPGIWHSIPQLCDAIVHTVRQLPDPDAVLILPSDILDLPHLPAVSALDVRSGVSYAFGNVAYALHAMQTGTAKLGGARLHARVVHEESDSGSGSDSSSSSDSSSNSGSDSSGSDSDSGFDSDSDSGSDSSGSGSDSNSDSDSGSESASGSEYGSDSDSVSGSGKDSKVVAHPKPKPKIRRKPASTSAPKLQRAKQPRQPKQPKAVVSTSMYWKQVLGAASRAVLLGLPIWEPSTEHGQKWDMGACDARVLEHLPFDMHGFENTFITREDMLHPARVAPFKSVPFSETPKAPETVPVNVAYMRARFCQILTSMKSLAPLLRSLKLIIGAGVVRGLLPAEQFVGFAHVTDGGIGYGVAQMLSAILRSPEHAVLAYTLDGMVTRLSKSTPLHSHGFSIGDSDVVPSKECRHATLGGVSGDGLPEGLGPDGMPEGLGPDGMPEGLGPDGMPEGLGPDGTRPAAPADASAAGRKRARAPPAPVNVYTYDPDRYGVPIAALRAAAVTGRSSLESVQDMDVVLHEDASSRTWYLLGARLNPSDLQPYVKTRNMELHDTHFPLLPSYLPLDHPGIAVFFAGTRYDVFSARDFKGVRAALGTIVAACTQTPSFTDVLLAMQNFPLFMHSKIYEQYRGHEGSKRVHEQFKQLDFYLQYFENHLQEAFQKGEEPQLLSVAAYDALADATPFEALAVLQDAFNGKLRANAAPKDPDTYFVYGRYKPAVTSGLRPCPFTVKAVEALVAAKLPHEVVEVRNAADATVPLSKPLTHTTVPVVFIKHGDVVGAENTMEFVGGFTDLERHLKK